MPNDNYVVDESPRAYTYLVADDVKVTVLVRSSPEKWGADEGVGLRAREDPRRDERRSTSSSRSTRGVWITVDVDTVRAVYQQYQP